MDQLAPLYRALGLPNQDFDEQKKHLSLVRFLFVYPLYEPYEQSIVQSILICMIYVHILTQGEKQHNIEVEV